jgi:hypothetical protein
MCVSMCKMYRVASVTHLEQTLHYSVYAEDSVTRRWGLPLIYGEAVPLFDHPTTRLSFQIVFHFSFCCSFLLYFECYFSLCPIPLIL